MKVGKPVSRNTSWTKECPEGTYGAGRNLKSSGAASLGDLVRRDGLAGVRADAGALVVLGYDEALDVGALLSNGSGDGSLNRRGGRALAGEVDDTAAGNGIGRREDESLLE